MDYYALLILHRVRHAIPLRDMAVLCAILALGMVAYIQYLKLATGIPDSLFNYLVLPLGAFNVAAIRFEDALPALSVAAFGIFVALLVGPRCTRVCLPGSETVCPKVTSRARAGSVSV